MSSIRPRCGVLGRRSQYHAAAPLLLPHAVPSGTNFLMSIKEASRPSPYCAGKLHAVHGGAMTSISEFLTTDHRHGDELFAAAAQAAEQGDWAVCHQQFNAFLRALKRHMKIEEEALFPAFEQATGITAGPTRVMRHEHQQMLALLEDVAAAIAAHDAARFRSLAQSFTALMGSHSAKEENVLYPMCDEALPGLSGEKLQEMMAQR